MKIKKEYILLALLIASSVGYLVFQRADRMHYKLPVLDEVKAESISSIEISREGKTTVLKRQDGTWRITPQNWRADQTKVSEMLDELAHLAVTDLVSETRDYDRYELDNGKKATIRAFAGTELRRDIIVGKAAPTYNHTYAMLPGDTRVYLVSGDIPRTFLVSPSEMRDMLVLSLTPSDITRIEIEHKGDKAALIKSEVPQTKTGDGSKGETDGKAKLFTWHTDTGRPVDKAEVDTILAGLAKVYCGEYLDDAVRVNLKNPETALVMKGSEVHTLSIFRKTGEKVPALSSQSESPFVMPDYKLEDIEKSLNKILEK